VRAQALVEDVQRLEVDRVVEVRDRGQPARVQHLLRELDPLLGERDRVVLLVERVVLVLAELRDDLVDLGVLVRRGLAGAADDQRRARFVDQDRVDLVDDREVQLAALGVVVDAELHVVAEVVEAELVVLAVGDVAPVGALLLGVGLRVHDRAGREPEEPVEPTHPLRVAAGEVVVDGDHVHALAREPVEVAGERGDQRLALAGLHLGDLPGVQHHPADQLHVVVAHPERALARLARDGEGRDQDVLERRAVVELLLELHGLAPQRFVPELLHLGLEGVDGVDLRRHLLELALVLGADDRLEDPLDHGARGRVNIRARPGYRKTPFRRNPEA
jgi:hypothetical protein